ncbi:peroxisomal d3,d2-enoyl-CoA isomeras-like protein [Cucurbitaria berberidis CBS 394.84]|uniref:Peroxisomal d3,d2-enoyl-CoA isomeras-like protein n=1 Tax=Cucurbitaria berberidis CBS 394.84 TaxID=1168544 RepID=A0A9P4L861_9PLEO|nr:peroxisomal d3,d2-enoyl-CoA isomeras-like protein [Cucurbitaria berberidis CBS 394.84]KAF1844913.1 peroxisomal d3,d2-enoyl-CoA isomeras-like protein [Cucurbitaria berberidis CBS 394.84]
MAENGILTEYKGKIAIITLNVPKKLNALDGNLYYQLARAMHEVAARDDVYITILTGKGRYFSAGADVSFGGAQDPSAVDERQAWLKNFVSNNLHITHAFYTHPKILVTALNGPAVGLSAALIAFSDFIYAAPHSFLLTPFSSLGLVAEGNASVAFVRRLGISKANEALIMSKRITIEELVHTGFVNKVIDAGNPKDSNFSDRFLGEVLKEVDDRLGDHLNSDSLIKIKALIQKPYLDTLDKQGVEEVFAGLERFLKGVPQEEFRKIASGEKKHKL